MKTDLNKTYGQIIRKKNIFILTVSLLTVLTILISLKIGSVDLSIGEIIRSLFSEEEHINKSIILNIRLPRILSACLVGMSLSVSGAVMQSLLRNPLGSPFTLGISHAAAFGAALTIILFQAGREQNSIHEFTNTFHIGLISVNAFLFSLVSTVIIILISKMRGGSPETMILSGIAIGSLFTAGIAAIQYFATDVQLASIIFWTFGDFGRAGWHAFTVVFIFSFPVLIFFIMKRWTYHSLDSGDEVAKSLGVNVNRVRITGMILASMITAIAISFYGIIAFVGLVVPHIVRKFVGANERFVIPASLFFGGFFLLLADTLSRTIISPTVLPVGILTSFLGAPLFVFLIIKRREVW